MNKFDAAQKIIGSQRGIPGTVPNRLALMIANPNNAATYLRALPSRIFNANVAEKTAKITK